MDATQTRTAKVTLPLVLNETLLANRELVLARQAAKSQPRTVVAVLATAAYKPRSRSANCTMPL